MIICLAEFTPQISRNFARATFRNVNTKRQAPYRFMIRIEFRALPLGLILKSVIAHVTFHLILRSLSASRFTLR
jgi:hypothetical protein